MTAAIIQGTWKFGIGDDCLLLGARYIILDKEESLAKFEKFIFCKASWASEFSGPRHSTAKRHKRAKGLEEQHCAPVPRNNKFLTATLSNFTNKERRVGLDQVSDIRIYECLGIRCVNAYLDVSYYWMQPWAPLCQRTQTFWVIWLQWACDTLLKIRPLHTVNASTLTHICYMEWNSIIPMQPPSWNGIYKN